MSPRNSSGSHSLPAGNPVIVGTLISPTWANSTLGDISASLTDSLSRSGSGGMTAPLRTADGTVAAPAHSFTSEVGSGLYRAAAGDVRLAVGGVDALKLAAGGFADGVTLVSGQTRVQVTLANGFLLLQGNMNAGQVSTGTFPADVVVRPTAARTAGFIFQVQRQDGNGILGCDYQGLLQLQNPAALQPASIWTAITPINGWAAGAGLSYFKDSNGVVHVKGTVIAPATGNNAPFTLPVGFRPVAARQFPVLGTGGVVTMQINADGTTFLSPWGNGYTYYMDPVSFMAEQ